MSIKLGLGVTTYNRAARLAQTLDAIGRHTATPHEIMVADDGSSDGTPDLLRRHRDPAHQRPEPRRRLEQEPAPVPLPRNPPLRCRHPVGGRHPAHRSGMEAAVDRGRGAVRPRQSRGRVVPGTGRERRRHAGRPFPVAHRRRPMLQLQPTRVGRRAYMDTRFGRYGYEHWITRSVCSARDSAEKASRRRSSSTCSPEPCG